MGPLGLLSNIFRYLYEESYVIVDLIDYVCMLHRHFAVVSFRRRPIFSGTSAVMLSVKIQRGEERIVLQSLSLNAVN